MTRVLFFALATAFMGYVASLAWFFFGWGAGVFFAALALIMALAAWESWREWRRQIRSLRALRGERA